MNKRSPLPLPSPLRVEWESVYYGRRDKCGINDGHNDCKITWMSFRTGGKLVSRETELCNAPPILNTSFSKALYDLSCQFVVPKGHRVMDEGPKHLIADKVGMLRNGRQGHQPRFKGLRNG